MKKVFWLLPVVAMLIASLAVSLPVSAASPMTVPLGTVVDLPQPPDGFIPLTASDADLAKYGLPPRPTNPADLREWNNVMSHAKTYVKGADVIGNDPSVGFGTITNSYSKPRWTGFRASPSLNLVGGQQPVTYPGIVWSYIQVPYNVPTNDGAACFWVGLDDNYIVFMDQAGFACSTNLYKQTGWQSNYCLFYCFASVGNIAPRWIRYFNIYPGDTIYVSVNDCTSGTGYYTWIDVTQGTYTTRQLTHSNLLSTHANADYIYESEEGLPICNPWGSTSFWGCQFRVTTGSSYSFPYFNDWNLYRMIMGSPSHIYGYAYNPTTINGEPGFTVQSFQ